MVILSVFMVIGGLVVGSFLNVVIYRLPREESLWSPPSFCPMCKNTIPWHDNIPLVSFFLLGARCRNCGKPISWRYPLVEGVCALFFLLILYYHYPVFFTLSSIISWLKDLLFICLLIPIFFIDVEYQIIPDSLSYTLLTSGIIFSSLQGLIFSTLIGIALGAGLFLTIFYLSLILLHQAGMGMGDVKIAAGIGAYFGWKMALLSFFLCFFVGAVVAGVLLLFHIKKMKDKIPFAPFLVAGALLTLFLGEKIVALYLSLVW